MTSKRLSHPLNRYATVCDDQTKACTPWARSIAHAHSLPLEVAVNAVIAFVSAARQSIIYGYQRTPQAATIEWLSWRKAMAAELKLLGHRSPDATTDQILEPGGTLHYWPNYYGKPSTLLELVDEYSEVVTLAHLTRLTPILFGYETGGSAVDISDTWMTNRQTVQSAMAVTRKDGLTPKQLEIFVSTARRARPAGRPRKEA